MILCAARVLTLHSLPACLPCLQASARWSVLVSSKVAACVCGADYAACNTCSHLAELGQHAGN
jgi:hypothetical protein